MNPCRFAPRHILFFIAAGMLAASVFPAHAQQDATLTTRDGVKHPASILSVGPGGIKVRMGAATLTEPFANVIAVTMDPPPSYTAAVTAFQSGDFAAALTNAQSVVAQFRGLPTPWAISAMSLVGDIYLATNRLSDAGNAYRDLQKAYPSAGVATIGLARIDVAKKDYQAAQGKIGPILTAAAKQWAPPQAASSLYGQASYVSGQIKEAGGDFSGALEDYLRTVTVFPGDQVAVASAQARADALRKEHSDTAVP